MVKPKALLALHDTAQARLITMVCEEQGFDVTSVDNLEALRARAREGDENAVIMDLNFQSWGNDCTPAREVYTQLETRYGRERVQQMLLGITGNPIFAKETQDEVGIQVKAKPFQLEDIEYFLQQAILESPAR